MSVRFDELRLDAGSVQELPDGSLKVVGRLTRTGIFNYRNPDGSRRTEYRPADEVFSPRAMATFAAAPVTINHPPVDANGRQILVNKDNWRRLSVGHLGESLRQDGDHLAADVYIRDAEAVAKVKSGKLRKISLGYQVDYDRTPGVTPDGARFDGVQRNIRGNHVALLLGHAPRGGDTCELRLDSEDNEVCETAEGRIDSALNPGMTLEEALAKILALQGELTQARTDAAEVPTLRAKVTELTNALTVAQGELTPARLDSLATDRANTVALAKASGVDAAVLAKPTLEIKRALVAKRTPTLATRTDSMSADALDAVIAVYADAPHPSMAAAVAPLAAPITAPAAAPGARTDSAGPAKPKTVAELQAAFAARIHDQWRTDSGDPIPAPNPVNPDRALAAENALAGVR